MASQFFGRFTKLDPPIAFGGFTAGGVIQFNSQPFQGTGPLIVEGTLQAVSGTTSKTLTFARAPQQFSYTDNFGDEIYYEALMGGNIVQTSEPERGYSFRNSRSFRGGDAYDRCEPGDVVWHNGRAFLITSATPYASAPESTQWQGDDPVATVWILDANINNLALPNDTYGGNTSAFESFETDDSETFGGNTLEIDNTGWETCQRFIYNRPSDSSPDPFYYPPNATFSSSPSAAEYWYNPFGRSFQLASHNSSRGDDYRCSYWVRGLEQWSATATDEVWAVENNDNAIGFTDSENPPNEDHVVMCAARIGGTFNRTFRIYKTAAGYPTLAIMWRTDAALDSACLAVHMAGDTPAASFVRATGGNGSYFAFTPVFGFPPVMAGDYYDLRFQITSTTFTIAITDEGGSEDILFGGALGGAIPSSPSGWLGIAVWGNNGARFSGFEAGEDVQLVRVGATGEMGVRVDEYSPASFNDVAYSKTVAKKTAQDIQSLVNVTADHILMTVDNTDRQRDTYGLSGSNITIYSEASGDLIQVAEKAPGTAPGGVGRGPQVPNTVDFYDPTDSATSKNRANWRDQVVIHDPDDEFQGIGGDRVQIMRNAVFDSTAPPDMSWTSYNPSGSAWTTMTAGTDYIGRWAAGLVFISSAFLAARAGEGVDDSLCFRAEGVRILHNGSQTARQFNDMAAALDAFDELFCNASPNGAGGIRISGNGVIGAGPSSYECIFDSACWRPDDFSWGLTAASRPYDYGDYPYWDGATKVFVTGSFDRSPSPLDCNGTPMDPATWVVPDLITYSVTPNDNSPTTGKAIQWGSVIDVGFFPPAAPITLSFNISGPTYSWPQIITRLPDGSVCEEAWAVVKFNGLSVQKQTVYYETRNTVPDSPIVNQTLDTSLTSANLSVSAFAIRRDSKQVTDINGDPVSLTDYDFVSLGTAIPATFNSGEARRVNVTALVNGLIAKRNSKYPEWVLWPSVAPLGASAEGLGGFLLSLLEDYDAGITATDGCEADYFYSASATYSGADSFEVSTILARFRLPDGSLTPVVPIINPPHMVAP